MNQLTFFTGVALLFCYVNQLSFFTGVALLFCYVNQLTFFTGVALLFCYVNQLTFFTGVALLFCYVNQLTFFGGCLVLNARRVNDSRHCVTCLTTKSREEMEEENRNALHILLCAGHKPRYIPAVISTRFPLKTRGVKFSHIQMKRFKFCAN